MKYIIKYNNIQATIGVDFATKSIEYKDNSLKLQIWDSAGQERYKSLIPSYVRGAAIIFIVYDISNKKTFNNLNSWINFIKENNTDNSLLILCGNKIDLQRQVTTKEGINLAEQENMIFFETSAKSGEGVTNMMYTCISKLAFFDKYNIDNKEKLIKELIDANNNDNVEEKKFNVDFDKNLDFPNEQNSSNIILKNGKNYTENEKKKCGC